MPAGVKKVNIQTVVAVRNTNPPICGTMKNIVMTYGDILKCLCKRAIVDEILSDGTTIRLNMSNYRTDNEKYAKKDATVEIETEIVDTHKEVVIEEVNTAAEVEVVEETVSESTETVEDAMTEEIVADEVVLCETEAAIASVEDSDTTEVEATDVETAETVEAVNEPVAEVSEESVAETEEVVVAKPTYNSNKKKKR